ncbi:hypothetical protein PVK06_035434 [Gossypium arboreum]|uniref:Uncharacterized protein n=1 Tax=Gossypium arboreum TaxID=29729 RepID=A0ABR0NJ20_GOSAR|nr:hypothetical protein PVK06_035434 [Gossypium arboreum]
MAKRRLMLLHQITSLKGKHDGAQTKNNQLKEEINHFKNEKSVLEEKLKAQEEIYTIDLERLRQSHKETFKKFQEDIEKNLIKALPVGAGFAMKVFPSYFANKAILPMLAIRAILS